MTIHEKIEYLKFEGYRNLSEWGRDFVDDLYAGLDSHELTDQEIEEQLSESQIEKINELYQEAI